VKRLVIGLAALAVGLYLLWNGAQTIGHPGAPVVIGQGIAVPHGGIPTRWVGVVILGFGLFGLYGAGVILFSRRVPL